jgi:hypothetical protein
MTDRSCPPLTLAIDVPAEEELAACSGVLARLIVEKALERLVLDRSDQRCEDVGNLHKEAPPGGETPNGAVERVL